MSLTTKSRLIVLHLTKYSDSSAVMHAIDSVGGRKSFLVRGLGKKHQVSLLHPLNILDAVSVETPKSSLAILKEWTPVAPLESIRSDIFKSSEAIFLSEVLYRSLRTEVTDESLFDWLCAAVASLETAEGSVANFHLWFLVSYIIRLGLGPASPEETEPKGLFSHEEMELLFKIMKSSQSETLALPLSGARRQAFAKDAMRYLSYHLGADLTIKSLPVLHELFQ